MRRSTCFPCARPGARAVLGASVALALGFGATAFGATAPSAEAGGGAAGASTASTGSDDTALQEVVVTAERRTENLEKVAISATVLSGEALTQQNKSTLDEIARDVPGVVMQENVGGYVPTIRGVTNPAGAPDASTAIYVDQVYSSQLPIENRMAYVDVNRVEVLRGPQGTLWGGNALGGAISIINNDPVLNHYVTDATVTSGNYDLLSGQAIVNVPISDQVAVRAVLASENRRGYYANGQDDSVYTAGRFKLLYQPSEDLRIVLTALQTTVGGEGIGQLLSPYPKSLTSLSNPWGNPAPLDLDGVAITPTSPSKYDSFRGNFQWNLGVGTLTFLPAYTNINQLTVASTGSGLIYPHIQHRRTNGELRLDSNSDSTIKWTVGTYYQHFNTPLSIYVTNPGIYDGNASLVDTTGAAFGQVTVPVTSAFRLTGGIRYTHESWQELDYWSFPSEFPGLTVYHPGSAPFHGTTWKAGTEFDVATDSMLYAQVATGWRTGGLFSNSLNGPPTPADPNDKSLGSFAPETLTAYEVGSKNELFNHSATLNAEAFYYVYGNYQVLATNPATGLAEEAIAQDVRAYGGEVESRWRVTNADTLDASVAYLHSTFGTQTGGAGSTADPTSSIYIANGSPTSPAPRWTVHAGYERRWVMTSGAALSAEVDGNYTDDEYVYFGTNCHAQGVPCVAPANSIFNAQLMWDSANDRWNATAYVRNIGNYPVLEAATPGTAATATSAATPEQYNLGPPRTFGLSLSLKLDTTH